MSEIKPKKERRFLKTLGRVGEILVEQVLLKLGSSIIKKIGGKKTLPSILFLFLSFSLFAQFPNTGNKQRLGFQTTADGLVWRGALSDTASIQPINNQSAWVILDTVNLKMYSFDFTSNVWNLVGGGGAAFTQPVDSLFFNTGVPTNNVDTAKMRWDSDLATVVLGLNDNVPNELGFKNFWLVKNQTGSTITKGSLVYANGTVGASGRITVAKFIANGSIDAKYLLGITAHDLTDGEDGYVISFGKIRQVNTDTFAAGAILYPSPTVAGVWTDVEPVAPNIDMPIGFCINSSVNNGTIAIRVASGYKLSELHDVAISSPVEKASLYYSGGLWRDTTAALLVSDTASMLLPYLRDADTVTLSNRINLKLNIADTSAFARDNQISGTSGQVAYFNSSSSVVSDTALRWSAANKSLGINMTTVPSGANLILKNSQEPVRTTVVANQTFGADTTNWTRGAGWTFNGTQAVATAATGNLTYTPALTITSGNAYEITYTLSSYTSGTLNARIGDVAYNLPLYNLTGNVIVLLPTGATGGFRFTTSTFTGNLDNISVVQIANPSTILLMGQDNNSNTNYSPLRMPNSTTIGFGGGATYSTGTSNIFFGQNSGQYTTTGIDNNFFGSNAGLSNTTGSYNNFFGTNAGLRNTTGITNNFFGASAGQANTTGSYNNFFGAAAGGNNTTGVNNNFFGLNAGLSNTTGQNNNMFGSNAGRQNTTGSANNFFGNGSGQFNTTGSGSNFFGTQAGQRNTTGNGNFIGGSAGFNNTIGTDNNFIGTLSGYENNRGSYNTFIASQAGRVNSSGSRNIAIGSFAMGSSNPADSLTGSDNIAIGANAAFNIRAAAAGNVAIGNTVYFPTNNGSNQGVYQNVLFFTGASGTGTTIAAASKAGIKTNAPNRDLEVAGEVRITDLTTDAPTRLVGADADGDLGQVTLGAGLSLASSSLLADTSFLVTRFDTASMLTNYLRSGTAASTYLPLTGGTLTGGLTGTSINLSSTINSSGDIFLGSNSSYSGLKTRYFKTTDISPNRDLFIGSVGTIGTWAGRMHFQTSYNTETPTTAMSINEFGNINMNGTLGVTGATTLNESLTVNRAGVPLFINSTNSNLNKISLQDNTTVRSYLGAGSTKLFTVANSSADEKFSVSNDGNTVISGSITVNSSAVFNEGSTDSDFRVESDGNAHMVFVDASTDMVGIGYASPTKTLDVNGEVRINTVTATPTSLLGKDGSNVVGEVTDINQSGVMKVGGTTANTSSVGIITVAHGLSYTPSQVIATISQQNSYVIVCHSKDATNLSFTVYDSVTGNPLNNVSVGFFWLAIK